MASILCSLDLHSTLRTLATSGPIRLSSSPELAQFKEYLSLTCAACEHLSQINTARSLPSPHSVLRFLERPSSMAMQSCLGMEKSVGFPLSRIDVLELVLHGPGESYMLRSTLSGIMHDSPSSRSGLECLVLFNMNSQAHVSTLTHPDYTIA